MTQAEADLAAALEADILAASQQLDVDVPAIGAGKGKSFEVWLLFSLVRKLQARGLYVVARDHADRPTKVFHVRGGPGNIRPKTDVAPQPSHFRISRRPKALRSLELHLGVKHKGVSGETHEVDISVVARWRAAEIRNQPNGGSYEGPRYACVELKNYALDSELDKNIARAFLGLNRDLANGWGFAPNGDIVLGHPRYALATTAAIGGSSEKLLQHYHIAAHGGLAPGAPEVDIFLDDMADFLTFLVPSPVDVEI